MVAPTAVPLPTVVTVSLSYWKNVMMVTPIIPIVALTSVLMPPVVMQPYKREWKNAMMVIIETVMVVAPFVKSKALALSVAMVFGKSAKAATMATPIIMMAAPTPVTMPPAVMALSKQGKNAI